MKLAINDENITIIITNIIKHNNQIIINVIFQIKFYLKILIKLSNRKFSVLFLIKYLHRKNCHYLLVYYLTQSLHKPFIGFIRFNCDVDHFVYHIDNVYHLFYRSFKTSRFNKNIWQYNQCKSMFLLSTI